MISKLTEGITVSVETFYQPEHSFPSKEEFLFTYRITIENHNTYPVQLLRRHWYIFDSLTGKEEVEGEGVVGVQPIIDPLGKYQYVSACQLHSELGKMHGTYEMENPQTRKKFSIHIPAFEMVVPMKLN